MRVIISITVGFVVGVAAGIGWAILLVATEVADTHGLPVEFIPLGALAGVIAGAFVGVRWHRNARRAAQRRRGAHVL